MRSRNTRPEPLTYRQLLAALTALPDDVLDEPVHVLDPGAEDVVQVAEALSSCNVPDELEVEGASFVLVLNPGLVQCYGCKAALRPDERRFIRNSRGGQDRVCSVCAADVAEFEAEQMEHQ